MNAQHALVAEAAATLEVEQLDALTQGGQKSVFRGEHHGTPIVLKVIFLQPPYHGHMLERARREVSLLAAIDSPHVVRVMSDLALLPAAATSPEESQAAAWIEEELDGDDLSGLLGSPWAWNDVELMLRDLAMGLHELHERKVVHRDLSPGNVRRLSTGRWKVMDPGLAKHLSQATITGIYQPGTPGFRTPEHVPGGVGPNPASDIFGLGILAYIALTGEFPILPGDDEAEYNRRLHEEQCPSASSRRPDMASSHVRLIDRMLQRQAARRFLDAGEFLGAIDDLVARR